mmetsp:Transcript_16811/g.23599  ORF Transcript_16811/g.23599 Transcript_16811/m.23599 type:complete len:106 (+) Transcript_16811:1358-1675(+)
MEDNSDSDDDEGNKKEQWGIVSVVKRRVVSRQVQYLLEWDVEEGSAFTWETRDFYSVSGERYEIVFGLGGCLTRAQVEGQMDTLDAKANVNSSGKKQTRGSKRKR